MLWLVLFSIPVVRGQCSQECGPISSLLSSCSLPDLDTDWHEFQHLPVERNLSGREYAPFGNGPSTARIATYDEARCFCTEAINSLSDCEVCARSACVDSCYSGPGAETPIANQNKVAGYYHEDCKAFGYFANSTLSSPSTTLSSMPPATEAPDYNSDCEICGVIHGQITECRLVDLDISPPPTQTSVLAEGYDYYGNLVWELRNIWSSDFDEFPRAGGKRMAPKEYFTRSVSRDVVSIVGLQDTGKLQGGTNRRARKLIATKTLGLLSSKPGDFPHLCTEKPISCTESASGLLTPIFPTAGPRQPPCCGGTSGVNASVAGYGPMWPRRHFLGEIYLALPPITFSRKIPQ
ncbi:hypothetical protein N7530_010296 [Penicillium desertorum]|uniref:Uncharacterized protein n=1 Tax=Penicillium desertorum TaxID=1303715 RepID=A0A9X0BIY4_9EURO|nr:hypothetical protein N7530_010296 [Penicillium desertorum]